MREFHLKTPLKTGDLTEINVGDVVYVSGLVVTGRDAVHKRIVEEGVKPPIDLRGIALFHAGPVVKKIDDKWRIVAIGPTTSMRMERYEAEFIEKTGIKLVIGKGFMGPRTAKACAENKSIVSFFPGGCAAILSKRVKKVLGVHWLELGVPEAMWVLEVEELGPLLVTIDSRGRNLYEKRVKEIESSREIVFERLRSKIFQILK